MSYFVELMDRLDLNELYHEFSIPISFRQLKEEGKLLAEIPEELELNIKVHVRRDEKDERFFVYTVRSRVVGCGEGYREKTYTLFSPRFFVSPYLGLENILSRSSTAELSSLVIPIKELDKSLKDALIETSQAAILSYLRKIGGILSLPKTLNEAEKYVKGGYKELEEKIKEEVANQIVSKAEKELRRLCPSLYVEKVK
jgi:hypothetical protein